MKKTLLKLMVTLAGIAFLSACSEGGMLNLKNPGSFSQKASPGSEFVSSSSQYQTTIPGNYKVQQSTGTFNSKVSQTSSPSGYKVYYSVQGAIISEEL
jgi:hypothetical protein